MSNQIFDFVCAKILFPSSETLFLGQRGAASIKRKHSLLLVNVTQVYVTHDKTVKSRGGDVAGPRNALGEHITSIVLWMTQYCNISELGNFGNHFVAHTTMTVGGKNTKLLG